ncbi:NAD(P)-dependent dehydrogenase (short-subunit alcohol dehydrogenase family) [Friedmanniella endophytica]|uniref:NAD(P)-dependent dehydrogenase (Short-subunit alcohol dehydrogenase family) n=1 Tax=Microlunatus kandeliicorticis TaxID=1759536 RepID=A0A7W3IPQ0_9ACTN|nr:SDR family NAD(P)-dependent oxidoreductase [Microlunatus kandeliicorticis]MBA8792966.1 NAD(P)-dependent dehydrogenase (short-subunit alcohol dehydrogenase family) [Microlunatus kandeliicorticis]
MTPDSKNALVVGASRGLGLGLAARLLERGWRVTATGRGAGSDGLRALAGRHGGLTPETVDIDDPAAVAALHDRLAGTPLDLLFVNAGVTHDRWETVADVSTETFQRVMLTNALSPVRFVEAFADLVVPSGTLAVMSSGQGSITNNTRVTGWEIYRASKAALNQLMRSWAARHPDDPRTLLLVAPGWVRTDLGGPDAGLSVEESTAGVADVLEAQAGRGGLQFLDHRGATVPW